MSQFKKQIQIDGITLLFSFYLVSTGEEEKYVVSVTRANRPVVFEMYFDGLGNWKLSPAAPDWLRLEEANLAGIIRDNRPQ